VEEFTQLVNSMQSMVIALREEYFKGQEVGWEEVERMGLQPIRIAGKEPTPQQPELGTSKTFSKLITNLRHAFAHGGYEFLGHPEITGIRVWNLPMNATDRIVNRTWEAELSEKELKAVAYLFSDYLESVHGPFLPKNDAEEDE
jgi:hypothetical protein